MATLGFVGLGLMGAPMATRLIEGGHDLMVWNRTRSKAEAFGDTARIVASPSDAAHGADAVITMLSDPEALTEVLFGARGVASAIEAPTALLDMSTVGPDHILDVARRMPSGVEVIDAPVLGSVSNAEDGTLTIFVGGSDESFARFRDVLAPLGTPVHLGPSGHGAAMKLVANSTLAGLMSLIGEALYLADGLGLDQDKVIPRLLDSPIGPALSRKVDKINSDYYAPSFKLSLMAKDMHLILAAARRRSVELEVIAGAAGWVDRAEGEGFGDLDYSAVVAHIRGRKATA